MSTQGGTLTCQIIVQQILLFFGEINTYTTLLGPKRLLISEFFPSKPDFYLHKWEKTLPACLLISEKSATYTIKWSYTIIWQVRVVRFAIKYWGFWRLFSQIRCKWNPSKNDSCLNFSSRVKTQMRHFWPASWKFPWQFPWQFSKIFFNNETLCKFVWHI